MLRSFVKTLTAALAVWLVSASAVFGQVVISQIYGGGGNSGATLRNDFVELFNRGTTPVIVSGWSVQYNSAGGSATWQVTTLPGSIPAGGYYLVQLAQGAGGSVDLPTPDATGVIPMSATAGKVALVSNSTALSGACPLGGAVVDFVGYGPSANCAETSPLGSNLSNTTAAFRQLSGCTDTNNNAADFDIAGPAPRNSASPINLCAGGGNQPIVTACPANLGALVGTGAQTNVGASDADGIVTTASIASAPIAGITLINVVPASGTGGSLAATLSVSASVAVGNYPVQIAFANNDGVPQTASCTVTVAVSNPGASVRIRDIQGRAHRSPLEGQAVTAVPGIVTAVRGNGFWFQDPNPDADPATSEGVFVFTSSAPVVSVGQSITVNGTVSEFRPGAVANNLTITQIVNPAITVVSSGNPLPAPVVIGAGGRIPPSQVIDDDATGDVETSGTFDPATDGIDFYESLEGMRVQVNNAVAVGPTNNFGEIPVVGDAGANAGLRTARGGIVIRPNDFNPERVLLDDALAPTPQVNVGDSAATVVGVMDYSFSNYKLYVTASPIFASGGLLPEQTTPQAPNQLAVASFNVENLDPSDGPAKFNALAAQIVTNLRAPDVIALIEVQDNNGATNDAVVDAAVTYNTLIAAISAAGGPAYQFRQIDPVDDQDGGEPGGNIRVGFLFNPTRVQFVDRPGGTSTAANAVVSGPFGPQLLYSPGRLQPTDPAFNSSRKPLAAEFVFKGHRLFMVANHWNSKGGDQPLFGRFQPPTRSTEVQRGQQAAIVASFVQSLLAADANANIVVLGDLNDFEFSPALTTLKNTGMVTLVETLPPQERYTYIFEGNSQVLDHILVSPSLASGAAPEYDVVHVNAEFATQTSDHDPEVVRLTLPTVDATSGTQVAISGLVFNRATQTFNGTLTITNTGARGLVGPVHARLDGLPAGVTLANAAGTNAGAPYVSSAAALLPGASIGLPVRFANPSRVPLGYTVRVFSGAF